MRTKLMLGVSICSIPLFSSSFLSSAKVRRKYPAEQHVGASPSLESRPKPRIPGQAKLRSILRRLCCQDCNNKSTLTRDLGIETRVSIIRFS
ncbi:hypothetical protein BJX70DRAFT_364967 [Aspergillus crustosus]